MTHSRTAHACLLQRLPHPPRGHGPEPCQLWPGAGVLGKLHREFRNQFAAVKSGLIRSVSGFRRPRALFTLRNGMCCRRARRRPLSRDPGLSISAKATDAPFQWTQPPSIQTKERTSLPDRSRDGEKAIGVVCRDCAFACWTMVFHPFRHPMDQTGHRSRIRVVPHAPS